MPAKCVTLCRMVLEVAQFDIVAGQEEGFAAAYREARPLVAQTPGLRATRIWRVSGALGGETDLGLVAAMDFDDRAAMDDGLRSDPMRQAACSTIAISVPLPAEVRPITKPVVAPVMIAAMMCRRYRCIA